MTRIVDINENEWLLVQSDEEYANGNLTTRVKLITDPNDPEFELESNPGELMIEPFDEDDSENSRPLHLSLSDQILLRDLLNKLHPIDVTVQKDY